MFAGRTRRGVDGEIVRAKRILPRRSRFVTKALLQAARLLKADKARIGAYYMSASDDHIYNHGEKRSKGISEEWTQLDLVSQVGSSMSGLLIAVVDLMDERQPCGFFLTQLEARLRIRIPEQKQPSPEGERS